MLFVILLLLYLLFIIIIIICVFFASVVEEMDQLADEQIRLLGLEDDTATEKVGWSQLLLRLSC